MPFIKGGEGRRVVPVAPPRLRAGRGPCRTRQRSGEGRVPHRTPARGQERTPKGRPRGHAAPPARRVLLLLRGWVGKRVASLAGGQGARLAGLGSPPMRQQPPQNGLPIPPPPITRTTALAEHD